MSKYLLARGVVLAVFVVAFLPTAGASASVCPNESLRSELRSGGLPDCRAYEVVSPAYTESTALTSVFAVSPEGSRLLVGSLGTFAGAEQVTLNDTNVLGAAYLLSRTSMGWAATSLGPQSSTYGSHGGMLDASTDLDASLWELPVAGVNDLYLEKPLGTFAKIGPVPEPLAYDYLGASEDLSRVLFSTAPGFPLYEYIGVEQPGEGRGPSLVGVAGGRGSNALISHCGTRLGSSVPFSSPEAKEGGHGSVYNAISGERVFFTSIGADHHECGEPQPPVDELFAREAAPPPSGSQPPEMRTVPISCPPAPLSPCADANFEGASHDGSKVFFTSTQKLVEGASEDHTSGDSAKECASIQGPGGCNLYVDELAGAGTSLTQRLALVSGGSADPRVQGVARISEDGSHVYFVAEGVLTEVPNGVGSIAVAGADNLYVYAEGHTSFVATLSPADAGDWAREDERPVLTSGEGRYLVFVSVADLTDEGLSSGKSQVFQYDAATGALVRVSIGQNGYNNDGKDPIAGSAITNGFPSSYRYVRVDSPTSASGVQAPADGAVFFSSPDALTPQALSDQTDFVGQPVSNIYEYRVGHVYLLSDGRDVSAVNAAPGVSLAGADPSGDDVFFFTSDSLVPGDGNTQQDLYDARVGGGFPTPAQAGDCGEACQGALAGAPALAPFGGSAMQAAEAEAPPPVSALGTTKPKAKTVKRSKPKKKRKARARRAASGVDRRGHAHGSRGKSAR
jgi:hypothetical protein